MKTDGRNYGGTGFEIGTAADLDLGPERPYSLRLTNTAPAGYERWPWRLESTEDDGKVEVRVSLCGVEVIRVRGPHGFTFDLLDAAIDGTLHVVESAEIDPDYS